MDQLVIAPPVRRPWRISQRRRRPLGRVLVISLWLHLTILALLLVTVRYERPKELMESPATVAMVFEGGQPKEPALPNPRFLGPMSPKPAPAPPVPEPPSQAETPSPPPPPPPPAPAPQTEAAPPPPLPPPVAERAPTPPPPPPPAPAPEAELPVPPPPPPLAMVIPRPPAPSPRPPLAQPRPEAPRRPPAFPEPMNFSFNPAIPRLRQPPRAASRGMPGTLDLSLAPRRGQATDFSSMFSRVAGAHVGPDWGNELIAWVKAHSYYPSQAAMNGEDGDVMVRVVANPDGRVTSVQLIGRSGSQWLDMALTGLFRGARLPPLIDQTEPLTFDFTMHYILIRGP